MSAYNDSIFNMPVPRPATAQPQVYAPQSVRAPALQRTTTHSLVTSQRCFQGLVTSQWLVPT
eukprot:CAMPEP_0185165240 /NCGR_PEP_ID=MMETSP1139-20130426/10626_1 /TAXON_ID=298111 /ORGANISM="Pavlova sp., Strain CCMP459" /LENGTH=61 /DNA_ID=CAMNT_0027730637 /DNA_START=59 /DNA_END=244 /DNA_ORIENTATION=-